MTCVLITQNVFKACGRGKTFQIISSVSGQYLQATTKQLIPRNQAYLWRNE